MSSVQGNRTTSLRWRPLARMQYAVVMREPFVLSLTLETGRQTSKRLTPLTLWSLVELLEVQTAL